MSIIVYGPPGCGKTRNAKRLAAHFGLTVVVDNWDPRQHRGTSGALHLTNVLSDVGKGRTHNFKDIRLPSRGAIGIRFLNPRFKDDAREPDEGCRA